MNNKKSKTIMIGIGAIAIIAFCILAGIFIGVGNTEYYSQIDNSKVVEIPPHGAMDHSYTLPAYDNNGNEKEISFETSRVLTQDAFIRLTVAPVFSFTRSWEEVKYDELPAAVQKQYVESNNSSN